MRNHTPVGDRPPHMHPLLTLQSRCPFYTSVLLLNPFGLLERYPADLRTSCSVATLTSLLIQMQMSRATW